MWILSFLPEIFIHIVFILGILGIIAGFVLEFIPLINKYILPIKVISLLLFSLGLYLEGNLATNKEWQAKIAELEVKIKEAEAKAEKKNVEIQTKIIEKTNTIYQKGDDIIHYIDNVVVKKEEVIKFIEHCPIPKDIVEQHNAAAKLNEIVKEGNGK